MLQYVVKFSCLNLSSLLRLFQEIKISALSFSTWIIIPELRESNDVDI